jgi:hypothetical protein
MKKYIRMGSIDHLREEEKYNGYCLSPEVNVDDIEKISFMLSKKSDISPSGDLELDSNGLMNAKGVGLDYVRLTQSIYREININAMRYDRRKLFCIKPVGATGIYIILFPGPKLRCGELANTCWFKLLIDNEVLNDNFGLYNHWAFKRLERDSCVSFSKWLSVDVHRLDHYIRAYDKILMSYASILAVRYRSEVDLKKTNSLDSEEYTPGINLVDQFNRDNTNTLGLIILIYLEDRRSTSKMLQNVRYLVMTGLSMFPRFRSTMDKFAESIRSPLQLYLLNKCLDFIPKILFWRKSPLAKFGNVRYDSINHIFIDSLGGSNIRLPRPMISGGSEFVEFSEILSEMYFTMLFNKNQDDPTHASFQILEKILQGEDNYNRMKQEDVDYIMGYSKEIGDIEFAKKVIERNNVHSYSKKAIEIGSILLRHHNSDPISDHVVESVIKKNVNKPISEFATFKSSSTNSNNTYNETLISQNPRRRCLEGVFDLLKNENCFRSLDVVKEYKKEKTTFQVFKKNQIGGVREILILPITNRIRINVLETISRNICQYDKREMLTHGPIKYESIKSCLYTSKKYPNRRAPIHITFDKTKWGPSFIPFQFTYLFTRMKSKLGSAFPLIVDLLIKHQNKYCFLPDRLMRAWVIDPEKKHSDELLQNEKIKFLKTKKISIKNCSNMGQGILHYTSSLLHLALISFRDELYKRLCKKLKLNSTDHEDLLSSDDSYTIFCPELSKEMGGKFISHKLTLFLKCQEIAERLFNCRTSVVKSSINPLVGEFNSLFISNMTFTPTLLKFCLSSVHPVNTDSFFRMVKESYSACRQIVENGGTMDLYMLASVMNKTYCESIYHTYEGGHNDLSNLDITRMPYHLGCYPIFNPALMLCFGPEYYNYLLYKKYFPIMTENEKKLFINSHKIVKGGLIETMAEFEDGDTILGGLLRIEALVGPIKQLKRIQESSPISKNEITNMLAQDPLLIIREPKTHKEVVFKTSQKLFTTGAAEALKNVAASIFYGRVSASVSADAYYIPNGSIDRMTYRDCLERLVVDESPIIEFESHMRFLYPKFLDYDIFIHREDTVGMMIARNPLEIQTIQKLSTHKIYTKLVNNVPDLLSYMWKDKEIPEMSQSKVGRDISIIKEHYPLIKDSLEETLDQFSGDDLDKTKALLLLILKLFSLKDRSFKGVIYGFGSEDIRDTYQTLMNRNLSISSTIHTQKMFIEESPKYHYYEKLYLAHNQHILSKLSSKEPKKLYWDQVEESDVNTFLQDRSQNINLKKRIFMSAVSYGYFSNIMEWSNRVQIILHKWKKRQVFNNGKYTGDFDLILFCGSRQLRIKYTQFTDKYQFFKFKIDDPEVLFEFFSEICVILNVKLDDILSKTYKGFWVLERDRVLKTNFGSFNIEELKNLEYITYKNCQLLVDDEKTVLTDEFGSKLFRL